MTREKALELLRAGPDGIREWNDWRSKGEPLPDLRAANLAGANLSYADLHEINLNHANLIRANMERANLSDANLPFAKLFMANCFLGYLPGVRFEYANLQECNFRHADLSHAQLQGARLVIARLWSTNLKGADFTDAQCGLTVFEDVDLSEVKGLKKLVHEMRSCVGSDTMVRSKGRIPEEFLSGCGMQPWEIKSVRLYDPDLTAAQISDLQYEIFSLRTTGPLFIGGVFISYSHADSVFVDKIYKRLKKDGVSVWLDRHDAVAGPLKRQVLEAIRVNDIMLLVLSKDSVGSDWVENELKTARKKEKEENRDVLCPITLDDAWKEKMDDPNWSHLPDKLILDFAKWKTKAFEEPYQKLLQGLKKYYPPKEPTDRHS